MKFLRENQAAAVEAVSQRLCDELADGNRVLWLVCGGSNIAAEVKIMKMVAEKTPERLGQLCIIPMDERYGKPGHADSNYKQLHDAGFDPSGATWIDILAKDLPLEETVERYTTLVATTFSSADVIIGVFGLGTDGHTAGVLPHTPATDDDMASVVGYDAPPYVRLTIMPHELIRTTAAYVLAFGENKKEPLARLHANKEDIADLPSSLHYKITEAYVYNDVYNDEIRST